MLFLYIKYMQACLDLDEKLLRETIEMRNCYVALYKFIRL